MAVAMRVTQRLMVEHSLTSLQTGLGRLARTQEQLSTGRVINRPSDSPTGTNTAMQLRAESAKQTQFARNAQDGLGWLGRLENTLTSVLGSVNKVRDLSLQGASTGSNGDPARAALATEVAALRESVLDQANTQHLGRPVFGGTTAGPAAYDPDGTFLGNTGTVQRTVADGVQVRVDVGGPAVFGSGPDSLFALLDEVVTHLTTDPEALQGDLTRLDDALSRIRTSLADVGTRFGRLDKAAQSARDITLDLQSSLSDVENVDLAKAMVDLQLQEVAYQASLASTARVLQPSLIDFLR